MAINTITQTAPVCNPFSGEEQYPQYLEGFSRADYDPIHYNMSGQLRSKLEKAILSGTNAQAFTILHTIDIIDHIPGAGNNFVPLNGFANFYGVSEEYLKGVLNRRKYIQKNFPDDVKRVYASDIVKDADIPLVRDDYMEVLGRDDLARYRLSDTYGAPCVSLPKHKSFLIYSPRIVLATALALIFTDKSGANNTTKKVALAIKRSDYRVIEQGGEKMEEISVSRDILDMSENGEIILSRELLDHIVYLTVRDTLDKLTEPVKGWKKEEQRTSD